MLLVNAFGLVFLHSACLIGCFILLLSTPICSQLRLRRFCHVAEPFSLQRLSTG
jgi:hypothetical protein